jgi:hypothetical protein
LKSATPRKNRGKYLKSYLMQNIWMDQNSPNLWDAFLTALKTIRYAKGGADAAEASEELTLLTLDEQLEEEAVADVENHPPTTVFNFVLATQPESSSKEDEATPGYFTQDLEDEDEFCPLGKTSEDVARALEEVKKVKLIFFTKIHTQKIGNTSEWRHQAPVSLSDEVSSRSFPQQSDCDYSRSRLLDRFADWSCQIEVDGDPDVIPSHSNRWSTCWHGASLGGPLCDTSKMYVRQVRLASHESKTTQKAQIT